MDNNFNSQGPWHHKNYQRGSKEMETVNTARLEGWSGDGVGVRDKTLCQGEQLNHVEIMFI